MIWHTIPSIYVDLTTGEIIDKKDIYKYYIIRTTKKITYNDKGTRAEIQHIRECRKCEQGKLFADYEK